MQQPGRQPRRLNKYFGASRGSTPNSATIFVKVNVSCEVKRSDTRVLVSTRRHRQQFAKTFGGRVTQRSHSIDHDTWQFMFLVRVPGSWFLFTVIQYKFGSSRANLVRCLVFTVIPRLPVSLHNIMIHITIY